MNVRLGVRYMSLDIEVSRITAESAENAEQAILVLCDLSGLCGCILVVT